MIDREESYKMVWTPCENGATAIAEKNISMEFRRQKETRKTQAELVWKHPKNYDNEDSSRG
ncbi:hypothetical protein C0J52_23714 [Blattella germanica]|nr:hypothetical protein C0J52_23714 [Blattella germanica]